MYSCIIALYLSWNTFLLNNYLAAPAYIRYIKWRRKDPPMVSTALVQHPAWTQQL